jgi:hypothetical protein
MLKIPGDVADIGTITEFDFTPATVTTIVADVPVTSNGTIALICVEDTEYTGAAVPFTDTCTPPSVVENGGAEAVAAVAGNPVPNSVITPPGEIGYPGGAKLAAFNTPCGFTNTPVFDCGASSAPK